MGTIYTETQGGWKLEDFFHSFGLGKFEASGCSGTPASLALDIYQVAFSFAKEHWSTMNTHPSLQLLEKAFERFMEGKDPTVFSPREKMSFLMQGIMSGKIFELARSGNHSLWKELSQALSTTPIKTDLTRYLDEEKEISRRVFKIADLLASRLAYRFILQFLAQLKNGFFLESIQMLAPVIPLLTLLSPYFYAFRRPSLQRFSEVGILLRGHLPESLNHRRSAWFTDTLDDVNGVSTTIQKMTSAAVALGYDLTVVVSRKAAPLPAIPIKNFEPIGEFELPEYELQKLSFPPLLPMIDYLEQKKFTEVMISTPGPVGLAALCAAKVLGLPTIGIYHTDFPQYVRILTEDGLMETLTWNYMHWFYAQMDLVYVNSEHYRHCWSERGFSKEKLQILPRGLDTLLFHPSKRDSSFWRERGLLAQEVGALYVGRLSREKNLDLLAAAFRRLLAQGVNVRPLFVGHGPYLETMRELLPEGIFLGALHGESLARAYASADFFVFPSTTDTFGNVVLEAQASGLPVIVSDIGGPKDLVHHDHDGIIIKGLDLNALTEGIKRLAFDQKLREMWGKRARHHVAQRNWEHAADVFWKQRSY